MTSLDVRRWADRARGGGLASSAASNLGAQGAALAAVSVASLLVAWAGGPTVVGEYALLRVLPWLFAVALSAGLPTASAYFLAGEASSDPRLRPTLAWMALVGAGLGGTVWLACAVPFDQLFFKQVPLGLVLVAGVLVVTQLLTVTAKACCQGGGDLRGANLVIVVEEAYFVLCYPVAMLVHGHHGVSSVLAAMIASGALAALTGALRLRRRGFFSSWGRPSGAVARRVAAFGGRGQLGNMLWLMNLRFDFVLLGALAGPAAVGIYAVASKFAELMRLAPTALNYVLYPRFASLGAPRAFDEARRVLPRATMFTLLLAPVLAVATYFVLPLVYGAPFHSAIWPAEVIIVGLSVEGAASVSSALLLGVGRPGLNSVGMGVGALVTVALDVVLIPRYGAMGGAVTSAVVYLVTTATLVLLARHVAAPASPAPDTTVGEIGHDTTLRRLVDVLVTGVLLVLVLPLLLVAALAVRLSSRGPVLFRQVRAGKDGRAFTLLKFRSMKVGAGTQGPLITFTGDPRINRIGALLRASKVDELPQLFNVLRGDMTLIGPRPEVPRFLPCYNDDERQLLCVRPGLTGPGQIVYTELAAPPDGRVDPEVYYEQVQLHPKLALDLDYLRRRSVRSDVSTLLRTFALVCHISRAWAPLRSASEVEAA